MSSNSSNFLKTLGPGIVFAGMCVGVSHLVQSTRAGADYGFVLLPAVLAAVIFKYPFFEFSSRYTSATGKSILNGYAESGKWILVIYALITVVTMFIVTAAVTFVTAGLMGNLFGIDLTTDWLAAIIFSVCIAILAGGKYNALDGLLKFVSVVLLLSTIGAAIIASFTGRTVPVEGFVPPAVMTSGGIVFLIALMGWMPTAVDMSTWTGLWAEERAKQTKYTPTLKETLLDFNIGYIITGILAVVFLSLGAIVMYGSGTVLSNSAAGFASQLVGLYTGTMGEWSYLIIAAAAFSTMFSTSITVLDGYGRAMDRVVALLWGTNVKWSYIIWVVLVAAGSFLVIAEFLNDLKSLVDLATTVSFIIAPFAAILNFVIIFSKAVPISHRPPDWLKWLAVVGILFLSTFTLIYFFILIF
ncbi:MAG TPA: divalent metal cation transporter [Fulvivirga sp.]|nr:divalent metal cation transporter [Fulvivirga sp.]